MKAKASTPECSLSVRHALRALLPLLSAAALLLASACSDNVPGGGSGDGGSDGGATDAVVDAPLSADAPVDAAPCVPTVTECGDMCGPVYDGCGETLPCGGCEAADQICDLPTHQCITPLVDCEDLGAECGSLRNSCGIVVHCPSSTLDTCPEGKECDPDTNTCVDCSNVTCADLGAECGAVWLGCGPKTNRTDCGDPCTAKGMVCNQELNICEPNCTPGSPAEICNAAKAAHKVECGRITDGCGNMVNCDDVDGFGCPEGLFCGTGGIGNRCATPEPPVECLSRGWECGTIESVCGPTLNCGTCNTDAGEVCNANRKCGAPCEPKTCNSPGYAGKCGTGLDDGCEGTLDCNVNCINEQVCNTSVSGEVGECVDSLACADIPEVGAADGEVPVDQACSNGPAFLDQAGDVTLRCRCSQDPTELFCVDSGHTHEVAGDEQGICCANESPCPATKEGGVCTTTNSCTGDTINCCTGSDFFCESGTTCTKKETCDTLGATGGASDPCSNDTAFDDGTGGALDLTCRCNSTEIHVLLCVDAANTHQVMGSEQGTCCENTAECPAEPAGAACTVTNSCSSAAADAIDCCVGGGLYCVNDTCCRDESTCPADPTGQACTVANTCNAPGVTLPGKDCCAQGTDLVCGPGNTCVAQKTCADHGANGTEGASCSNGPAFDDGSGGDPDLTCGCNPGLVCSNASGVVSGSTIGTCCNNTVVCDTAAVGIACVVQNACTKQDLPSCCTGNLVCDSLTDKCATKKTCSDYTNGKVGSQCSRDKAFDNGDNDAGLELTCGCDNGLFCTDANGLVSGSEIGTCCDNSVHCAVDPLGGPCSVTNECTLNAINCCTGSQFCNAESKCEAKLTCGDYGLDGTLGSQCSNGGAWDNGDGDAQKELTCRCDGGLYCVNGGGDVVSGSTIGNCCQPHACGAAAPIGGKCKWDDCGPTVECGCDTSGGKDRNHCGASGVCECEPLTVCPGVGTYPNGCGGTIPGCGG